MALLPAAPAGAGDWLIFTEVPHEELNEIAEILEDHCRIEAESQAEALAFLALGSNADWFREELKTEIFRICREAAAYSAIQYGAALNRARRQAGDERFNLR